MGAVGGGVVEAHAEDVLAAGIGFLHRVGSAVGGAVVGAVHADDTVIDQGVGQLLGLHGVAVGVLDLTHSELAALESGDKAVHTVDAGLHAGLGGH